MSEPVGERTRPAERNRASVRREVRIAAPADDVWAVVGDPSRLAEWFPGVASCAVDGTTRVVTTGSGLPISEELLTVDRLQRRFQYRITTPPFREHLATVDVHDLGDGSSLVVYGTDADPATMALVLAGAAGNALQSGPEPPAHEPRLLLEAPV